MKDLIVNKVVILIVFTFSLASASFKDTIKKENIEKTEPYLPTNLKALPEKINVDSIIIDAKNTVESYNKSVLERQRLDQRLVNITRKEIEMARKTNAILKELIKKSNKKREGALKDSDIINDLRIDTVCTKEHNRFLGKKKCREQELIFYVYKKNKKIILYQLKQELK